MSNDFEKQMAIAMKKSRQKAGIPFDIQIESTLGKIKVDKEKFRKFIKDKEKSQAKALYKELIYLRAQLCALQVLREKQTYGHVDKEVKEKFTTNYTIDCANLFLIINSLA